MASCSPQAPPALAWRPSFLVPLAGWLAVPFRPRSSVPGVPRPALAPRPAVRRGSSLPTPPVQRRFPQTERAGLRSPPTLVVAIPLRRPDAGVPLSRSWARPAARPSSCRSMGGRGEGRAPYCLEGLGQLLHRHSLPGRMASGAASGGRPAACLVTRSRGCPRSGVRGDVTVAPYSPSC